MCWWTGSLLVQAMSCGQFGGNEPMLAYCQLGSHCNDVIMGAIASQITSPTTVYSTVYSDPDQRKHQTAASLAFVCGIPRAPVTSPHKWPVTRKMFPFDDVIMRERISVKFEFEFYHFHSRKCFWKCRLPKRLPFCPGGTWVKSSTTAFI